MADNYSISENPARWLSHAADPYPWRAQKDQSKSELNVRLSKEFDFGRDIYHLFQRTYDGQFRYIPHIMSIFAFGRPISLVSYSTDGVQAPQVYVYNDVLTSLLNGTTYNNSAVREINGQGVGKFLEECAMHGILQDPDALYNNIFFSLAQASLGGLGIGTESFAGGGRGAHVYDGPETAITFDNGTTSIFENFARVLAPFGNIKNGSALYKNWINPDDNYSSPKLIPTVDLRKTLKEDLEQHQDSEPFGSQPGYPKPVALSNTLLIGGYHLNQSGYKDVAVLSVPSFLHYGDYQKVAYDFLDNARRDGKKKLVIDLSAIGGGSIMEGYSLFMNLFPGVTPYAASRSRNHEVFDIIGETVSERMFYYPFDYNHPPNSIWTYFVGTPFNYRSDADIDNKNFRSWREKNPLDNQFAADNFTAIIRWNLSDPLIQGSDGLHVNGYGSRAGLPPSRPFGPENIVLLYDGYCASTCTIFSELLTQQIGNIKTVSIGGRPNNKPMQTIGGTKGTNDWSWASSRDFVRGTYSLAPDQAGFFNSTVMYAYLDETSFIPLRRGLSYGASLNVRDVIRYGDKTQTSLQFVYSASDCRLYYTAKMTVDVVPMWKKVSDVAWYGNKCVVGGFDSKSPLEQRSHVSSRIARRAHEKKIFKHGNLSAGHVARIGKTLDVLKNRLQPQPGLMLP